MHAAFRAGFEKTADSKLAGIIATTRPPVLKGQRATIRGAAGAANLGKHPPVSPPTGAPANVNPSVARG